MFDRTTYQPGVAVTPAPMAYEGERVIVWRDGWGWVDRLVEAEAEPVECEDVA